VKEQEQSEAEEKNVEGTDEASEIATNHHNHIQEINTLIDNTVASRRSSFKKKREYIDE
jgi:hypothetical protein